MRREAKFVKCREATEIFGDHFEGTLRPLQRWRLRLHLWICHHCRNYLFSYTTTVRAEKAAHREVPESSAAEAPEALVKLIASAAKQARDGDGSQGKNAEDRGEH
jgi:Putative zinc-finger